MLNYLILMRHAKSSWSDSSLSDHQRPLNTRGRAAAQRIGAVLHARGYAPDLIWSSDSVRTRQTAMLVIRHIPGVPMIDYIAPFYHASAWTVLKICETRGEPDGSLMLLGHNPGWSELYYHFTSQSHDFPTAACAVLKRHNDGHWLSPDSWRLKDFLTPKQLSPTE